MLSIQFVTLEIRSVLEVIVVSTVIARVRSGRGKFRELLLILTSRALSHFTREQIYSTYILPVLYASECWAPSVNYLLKLERNDRAMVRGGCNVHLKDRISSDDLLEKFVLTT